MIILLINWLIDENRIFGRHVRNKILKYLRRDIRVASKKIWAAMLQKKGQKCNLQLNNLGVSRDHLGKWYRSDWLLSKGYRKEEGEIGGDAIKKKKIKSKRNVARKMKGNRISAGNP